MIGQINLLLPPSIASLFYNWSKLAPFSLSNMSLLKHCWMWMPKILYWKIWLERNKRIFRGTSGMPSQVAVQIKS